MRKRASMILRNTFALLLAVTLTVPLFAQDRFIPASDSDPVVGRYLVLFAGDDPAADESTADAIARTYGARIEPYADSSVRGAVMHMRPAQARLLSEDLRVSRVEEQPLSGDAVPRAPQPGAAAPAVASFTPMTTAETSLWSSGMYEYDDTGNIKKIGSDSYRYDGVGRLVYATAFTPGNANNIQSYAYDEFGNMTLRVTDPHGTFPVAETYVVNAATNQLTSAQYDDTGNQISIEPNGGALAYDAAGMLMTLTAGSNKLAYVYDANDERIVTVELVNGNESRHRYTLRGTDNKIARELTLEPLTMNWHLVKDYVHRGGALMASFSSPTATTPDRHYHLDHLGSTRLITDASGTAVARLTYYPFGLEAPGSTSTPGDRLKFTGHERDTDGAAAAFNLDYMHARYYNGGTGRFLSVDPATNERRHAPQTWNRYAYTRNNPLLFVDPDGRDVMLAPGLSRRERNRIIAVLAQASRNPQFRARLAIADESKIPVVLGTTDFPDTLKNASPSEKVEIQYGVTSITKSASGKAIIRIDVKLDFGNIDASKGTTDPVTDVLALAHEIEHTKNYLTPEGRRAMLENPECEEDMAAILGETAEADPNTKAAAAKEERKAIEELLRERDPQP